MSTRPPATIAVYVVKWVAILGAGVVSAGDDARALVAAALVAAALVGLVARRRVAWAVLVLLEIGLLASFLVEPPPPWVLPLAAFGLALLLAPPSRRFVGPSA